MGREKELGSIEVGKRADLVVLDADPLQDIRNTATIRMVMKDGYLWEKDEIIRQTPEDLVQQQLNAYNARDIAAFASTYAPAVEIYNFPNHLRYQGIRNLHKRYARWFRDNPELHAKNLNRIVMGKFIIDREQVTGRQDGRVINAVAIYQVEDNRIRRVWFIRE